MAEATLNSVSSAAERVDGSILCRVNITTPEGQIWDTDYIVPRAVAKSEDTGGIPAVGLARDVYDWVQANPDQVAPYVEGQEPVPRADPVWENQPPPDPPPGASDYEPPPELVVPGNPLPKLPDYEEKPADIDGAT